MDYVYVSAEEGEHKVPSIQIEDRTVVVTGQWVKLASVHDEDWQEGEVFSSVEHFVTALKDRKKPRADLFTFAQKPTDLVPHHAYYREWESVAAIPILSYSDWWENRVCTHLRKDVRRAAKRGIVVRVVPFSDEFVRAVMSIYNETPVRQGRLFRHYQISFDEAKRANSTYLDRSVFVGAYFGEELVGFLKIVYVDQIARLMQIISKDAYRGERPMNALIAKAVELVDAKKCLLLTYGKYCYAQGADSVTAFKARNGFEEILVPRYYIPLTIKGRLALLFNLHHGVKALVPNSVRTALKRLRLWLYERTRVKRDSN
ncbi:MAG: hypothetical protein P4K86_10200 [Terracidiphilus sp.]|nr:hypothetical protein [Terracidiphilus sp.]MDR3775547.1 hypothetical protein [Terracidiphilus sp.]